MTIWLFLKVKYESVYFKLVQNFKNLQNIDDHNIVNMKAHCDMTDMRLECL